MLENGVPVYVRPRPGATVGICVQFCWCQLLHLVLASGGRGVLQANSAAVQVPLLPRGLLLVPQQFCELSFDASLAGMPMASS